MIGILIKVCGTMQGHGCLNCASLSGATEMITRYFAFFGFIPYFGYWAICFIDQAAWITRICYIVTTLFRCVRCFCKPYLKKMYR